MYIPPKYANENLSEIALLVREFSFATLVSVQNGLPLATHLPLHLHITESGNWQLLGHVAKANPQWKGFATNEQVLAIFHGPHAYISPSWYNHRNVPTWNYQAVHLHGRVQLMNEADVENHLRELMAHYEHKHAASPQAYSEIPSHTLHTDLKGLVAFTIAVEKIEAANKLSQGRDPESYVNIIHQLSQSDEENAKRIAYEMKKNRKET